MIMRHTSIYKCTPLAPREDSGRRTSPKSLPLASSGPVVILRDTHSGDCTVTAPCIDTKEPSNKSLGVWHRLADGVLAGETLSREQALTVLDCPDVELLDL